MLNFGNNPYAIIQKIVQAIKQIRIARTVFRLLKIRDVFAIIIVALVGHQIPDHPKRKRRSFCGDTA